MAGRSNWFGATKWLDCASSGWTVKKAVCRERLFICEVVERLFALVKTAFMVTGCFAIDSHVLEGYF